MKNSLCKALGPIDNLLSMIPEWAVSLAMRLVIFKVFWFSVQTKIYGLTIGGQHFAFWQISDSAYFQFYEFPYAILHHEIIITLATYAEFFLPILILFGLFTRFAALGLFFVTLVIQLVMPDAFWSIHIYWFLIVLYLMRNGGGLFSIDRLLLKR